MDVLIGLARGISYDQVHALSAGVAKVFVFDLETMRDFALALRNTLLVNVIGTTKIETGLSNEDASYQEDTAAGAAIGSIAASAGATGIATYRNDDCNRFVRVTVTSAGGTTVRVQARVL